MGMRYNDTELTERYLAGASTLQLARESGVTKRAIWQRLVRLNVPRRPSRDIGYTGRDRFATIETPEDAYWLGFLCADGGVTHGVGVSVALQSLDREHLVKFCKYMGAAESRIGMTNRGLCRVTFGGPHICERLTALGCTPAKSKTLMPPPFTDLTLIHAYLAGYFDGDGCACIDGQGRFRFTIVCGSLQWLEWAADHIRDIAPNRSQVRPKPSVWGGAFVYELKGPGLQALRHWATLPIPRLDRKLAVYQHLL